MSDPKTQPESPAPVMRRLKRSKALHVSGLMATAAFTMSACDGPVQQTSMPVEQAQPVLAYVSLEACKAADEVSDETCDTAFSSAQQEAATTSPRYASRELCEQTWGVGQCNTGSGSDGGSFFTPLMAGFIVGQMLNGGGYRGGPMYRDRDDQYVNGGAGGGYIGRDWRTGQTTISRRNEATVREAPSRVQSRTTVVSRGGFGGGGRGYGG